MGNLTKTFTLQVQADAAMQEVEALRKKLRELDDSLEGVSRDSDIGRGIVAEMGKVAASLETAEGRVGSLNKRLDGLQPGTIGALRQEVRDLNTQLNNASEGTAEYEQRIKLSSYPPAERPPCRQGVALPAMESNALFVLGAHLDDPTTDPQQWHFQQGLFAPPVPVLVPGPALGQASAALAERVADCYLAQYPAEAQRVGRATVVRVVRTVLEQDPDEPGLA